MSRAGWARRGVALVLVLWLVVVLGAVATTVIATSRASSRMLVNARVHAVARYAAESGAVAGLALIQRLRFASSPAQQVLAMAGLGRDFNGLREVDLAGVRFSVRLTNLNARIDLNESDPQALVGFLTQFTSAPAARSLGDAILDWRDGDDLVRPQGAEKDAYQRAGSAYVPRNGPFTRYEEFLRVRGVTSSLARKLEPYLTVNGDFRLDVNAAPEAVLSAFPGIGAAGARELIARRESEPFTAVSQVVTLLRRGSATSAQLPFLTVAPTRLLLTSRGWMPGHPLTHEVQAVYAISRRKITLQSWRERDQ